MKLIAPALAEIKPVYYTGEEKLVSLDMLKLYCGEDMISQNPEDIDPIRWLDEGELTELLETPVGEVEIMSRETTQDWRDPEIPLEPDLKIPVIPEDPEVIAVREGMLERIQAEIHLEDKEAGAAPEEMLEVS